MDDPERKAQKAKNERHRRLIYKTADEEGYDAAIKLAEQLDFSGRVPTQEEARNKRANLRQQHSKSHEKQRAITETAAQEGQEAAAKLAEKLGFSGTVPTQEEARSKLDILRKKNNESHEKQRAITKIAAEEGQVAAFELGLNLNFKGKALDQKKAREKLDIHSVQKAAWKRERRYAKLKAAGTSQQYQPPGQSSSAEPKLDEGKSSNDDREEQYPQHHQQQYYYTPQLPPQPQGGPGPLIQYQQYHVPGLPPGAPWPPAPQQGHYYPPAIPSQQGHYYPPAISPQQGAAGSAGNTDEQVARVRAEREQYWADRRGQGRGRGRGGQGHWDPNQDLGR